VPGVLSAAGNAGEQPPAHAEPVEQPKAFARPGPERLSPERRVELDALAKSMMPDFVDMMRTAVATAIDESLEVKEREQALLDLEDLASDVDNARDLKSLGGYSSIVALVRSEHPALQAAAAWVVGSAVKHHRELQLHLLDEHALPALLEQLRASENIEVRAKALFATSAILRHCPETQAAFVAAGGPEMLLALLARPALAPADGGNRQPAWSPRLVRKALVLITDLAREQRLREEDAAGVEVHVEGTPQPAAENEAADTVDLTAHWRGEATLCAAVVQCLESDDVDTQEKAIQALEELMRCGLLQPSLPSSPSSGCAMDVVRSGLQRFRDRCKRALQPIASTVGAEDEVGVADEEIGSGECEELLPIAEMIDRELAA